MKLRRRAVLKWTGASLCALIFAAWFASRWFEVVVTHLELGGERCVGVGVGVVWTRFSSLVDSLPPRRWDVGLWMPGVPSWVWCPRQETDGSGQMVIVPLYLPLALLAIPTSWLFYHDRRTVRWAREGGCAKCGYSLSGLPPGGACPECGKAA